MGNDKIECNQCGNCCRGMIWRKRFGFDEVTEIIKNEQLTKKQMEEIIIEEQTRHLAKIGIPVKKTYPLKWDANERRVTVYVKGGRCKYLEFITDKKSICMHYKNRSNECEAFFCKKARTKAALNRIIKDESKKLRNLGGKE